MISRLLSCCLLLAACAILSGQTFEPLGSYEELYLDARGVPAVDLEKVACEEFDLMGFLIARPGSTTEFSVTPDTLRLMNVSSYSCSGCSGTTGGRAILRSDTLVFTANDGVVENVDEITVTACDEQGNCSAPRTIRILTQRAAQSVDLTSVDAAPGEEVRINIPRSEFAAAAVCRSLSLCAEDYAGRGQEVGFLTDQNVGNDVLYTAARYGGTDEVCVTLCSPLGLCDTFRTAINVIRPTVGLPFFDDFSAAGPRPDGELWQDVDVYVNRTFADRPPSVGVATFDALALDGKPYTTTQGGRNGVIRDYLTSAPLNTAGQTGAALSFYVQPRGLGNRPETRDSFLVQFLAPNGNWRTVLQIEGLNSSYPGSAPVTFDPYTVELDDEYLYNGFTFRFASKSGERGAVDMWHLDYVKLTTDGEGIATADLALSTPPGSILGPMTSLPLRHFQAAGEDLVQPALTVNLANNNDARMLLDEEKGSTVAVQEGRILITRSEMTDPNVFGLPTLLEPLAFESRGVSPDWAGFGDVSDYLNGLPLREEPLVLTTTYNMAFLGETRQLGPLVQANNRSSSTTILGEYMAYDDATAEGTIEAQRQTVVTQRYTAYVADELKGVQIRIPRSINDLGDQSLRLVVYGGDEQPGARLYGEDMPILFAETFADSLQGYTTYLFDDPVALPEGNFFVGWEQIGPTPIGIGYDRNASARGVQFFDQGNNGEWQPLFAPDGALMIRPLLANFDEPTTSLEEALATEGLVDVFPNPTTGLLHLRQRPTSSGQLRVTLYDATGALLRSRADPRTLDLSDLPPGFYLLDVTDGRRRSRHKVVLH